MGSNHLRLVYVDSRGREHALEMHGRLKVGRSPDADIVLLEEGVSRLHCEFRSGSEGVEIRDLGSTNGTFVNGSKVQEARLKEGDTVVVGRILLRLENTAEPRDGEHRTTFIGTESVELAVDASREDYRPESLDADTVRRHLQSLYGILSTISTAETMEGMFRGILSTILHTLSLDFGHVLLGTSAEALEPVASLAVSGGKPPPFSYTVVRRALRQSQAILANDIQAEPDLAASDSIAAAGALRIACAPILLDQRIGAIYVASKGLGGPLRSEDILFLSAAARQIGLAAQALADRENLARENELLRQRNPTAQLIGSSEAMQRLRSMIRRAAAVDATVLIVGESGTGKELVARGIHEASSRVGRPFVALNCGALPASVVQSELFGHEKGAFTGAESRRLGLVELAHGGTLFLDEIGELSPEVQVMLLRLLEEKRFYRVGGQQETHADVRFVAATHRDLDALAEQGKFRADLLYRLKVVEIQTPALRDHPEDLNEIADALLMEIARSAGKPGRNLAPEAQKALLRHSWPGNVRELRNVLERAVLLHPATEAGAAIEAQDLGLQGAQSSIPTPHDPLGSLSEMERSHIRRVLEATGWNKTRAAEILGVARITLYEKIRTYGLKPGQ